MLNAYVAVSGVLPRRFRKTGSEVEVIVWSEVLHWIECTFGRDFQVYTFGRTTLLEDTVLLEEMHFWKKYTFGRLCILLAEPSNFKPF